RARREHLAALGHEAAAPFLDRDGDGVDAGDERDEVAVRPLHYPDDLVSEVAQGDDGGDGVNDVAERGEADGEEPCHPERGEGSPAAGGGPPPSPRLGMTRASFSSSSLVECSFGSPTIATRPP